MSAEDTNVFSDSTTMELPDVSFNVIISLETPPPQWTQQPRLLVIRSPPRQEVHWGTYIISALALCRGVTVDGFVSRFFYFLFLPQ